MKIWKVALSEQVDILSYLYFMEIKDLIFEDTLSETVSITIKFVVFSIIPTLMLDLCLGY